MAPSSSYLCDCNSREKALSLGFDQHRSCSGSEKIIGLLAPTRILTGNTLVEPGSESPSGEVTIVGEIEKAQALIRETLAAKGRASTRALRITSVSKVVMSPKFPPLVLEEPQSLQHQSGPTFLLVSLRYHIPEVIMPQNPVGNYLDVCISWVSCCIRSQNVNI